ncbi:hypothetical protein EV383_3700 [Pseudonocardia sediminis]|uniref:Uncharacterized protein n=1 Tax=Pseudonocardia sediminis TaxID=1397368 RepID=A0A4Q7V0G9_PSEST|nr:hypothetical protein [Pseudonocardia sediminis]RZT86801.1 hypothetical protein EV383_3700 [Pseudonocardia sediminis]
MSGDGENGDVIIAVEGPSAAGKTTWCSRQPWPVVAEYQPTGHEPPDDVDESRRAAYWVDVDVGRWGRARTLERGNPIVLCDGDPVKLHYSWCLARVGAAPWSRFDEQLRHARAAFAAGRLGMADLVMVSIPSVETLHRRRAADRTRRRRSFDLHVSLRESLREWHSAVESADPGRVVWSFPPDGVPAPARRRSGSGGPALLERLVTGLPAGVRRP